MASMTTVKCAKCKTEFEARTADVKRGWGKFCSKSCKAFKQTSDTGVSGPDYRASKRSVQQMKQGHYAKSKFKGRSRDGDQERWFPTIITYDVWDEEVERGDVKYSHKHRTWLVRDDGNDPLIDSHPFDSDAAGFRNT